jgi:hypothetical protein
LIANCTINDIFDFLKPAYGTHPCKIMAIAPYIIVSLIYWAVAKKALTPKAAPN